MEDATLIQKLRDGDREAFALLVARHQAAVHGYLRARLLQPSDADDLAQEVFLRSYLAAARFDAGARVRPWLLGIARNLLREHVRRLRRRKEVAWTEICLRLDDLAAGREEAEEDDEALLHLPGCLEGLGESAREALDLHYGARLRLADIGLRLRRSEGAVKLLLHRARQALRVCLGTKCAREPPGAQATE